MRGFISTTHDLHSMGLIRHGPMPRTFAPFNATLSRPSVAAGLRCGNHVIGISTFPINAGPNCVCSVIGGPSIGSHVTRVHSSVNSGGLVISTNQISCIGNTGRVLLYCRQLLRHQPRVHNGIGLVVATMGTTTKVHICGATRDRVRRLIKRVGNGCSALA